MDQKPLVDLKRLVQDLQNHKIELEQQNEELRRTELRLRNTTRRYADLYDFAPVGYLTFSRHGVIREINLKGVSCLHRDRIHLIGSVFHEYVVEEDRMIFIRHMTTLFERMEKQICKIRIRNGADLPFVAQLESVVWAEDETGELFVRSMISDISTQSKFENELIRAKEKAEQANLAKNQFLANMSHEIRTPLAVILGYCDLLQREAEADDDVPGPVESIRRSGEHLLQLIDDILDISRVESGQLAISFSECSAEDVIRETMESLRAKALKKKLELSMNWDADLPSMMLTDATRLRQIILNLIGNAIKFTEEGAVSLVASHSDGFLQIDVSDTGCGISEIARTVLFKPFSQVDPSNSRKFGGIGLGLYLSRRLAQALGGDVTLLESSHGGSTFRVQLSLKAGEPVGGRSKRSPSHVDRSALKGSNFLLVEDNPDIQRVIRSMIELAGGTVYCANDGIQAVTSALEQPIDLVLMDLQLPLQDGYQATSELRRKHFKKPVLALTAHAFREERERVLAADFNGFLTKPIGFKPLVDALTKWVGKPSTPGPGLPLH